MTEEQSKHLGFTGTRKHLTPDQGCDLVDALAALFDEGYTHFHHGDCIGADEEAHAMAVDIGYHIVLHPPINDKHRVFCSRHLTKDRYTLYKAKDYLVRNQDIVNGSTMIIACPDRPEHTRSGTWSTVRKARAAKKLIRLILPETKTAGATS